MALSGSIPYIVTPYINNESFEGEDVCNLWLHYNVGHSYMYWKSAKPCTQKLSPFCHSCSRPGWGNVDGGFQFIYASQLLSMIQGFWFQIFNCGDHTAFITYVCHTQVYHSALGKCIEYYLNKTRSNKQLLKSCQIKRSFFYLTILLCDFCQIVPHFCLVPLPDPP